MALQRHTNTVAIWLIWLSFAVALGLAGWLLSAGHPIYAWLVVAAGFAVMGWIAQRADRD